MTVKDTLFVTENDASTFDDVCMMNADVEITCGEIISSKCMLR